tara:strand:- start:360 stop:995 length:636 start_codon:yes stop_codon:yes gene_type:complete
MADPYWYPHYSKILFNIIKDQEVVDIIIKNVKSLNGDYDDYEENNTIYTDKIPWPYGEIKCKNHEICDKLLPIWWKSCKGQWLCTNCDVMFGTWGNRTGKGSLNFYDNLECPICLEIKRSITHANCEHTLCIKCFKRCYYGEDIWDTQPQFPYPDIEDEYDDDDDHSINIKWEPYRPLINEYHERSRKWDDDRLQKLREEENLRCCPLCRK